MKPMLAFAKKEWIEQVRSGRLAILCIVFVLLGIMNPAFAKAMPWLIDMAMQSLEAGGLSVAPETIDAIDSWMQFFKNIPIGLIAFLLIESNIFVKERQLGTLVLPLTKGLNRYKVVLAKAATLLALWTLCFWLCAGITYAYNEYFWNNSIAQNLSFSLVCWWLFGVWTASMTVLFSTLANSNATVLAGTGLAVLGSNLAGLLAGSKEHIPTLLQDGNSLIMGMAGTQQYETALWMTVALSVLCLAASIPIFNKRGF